MSTLTTFHCFRCLTEVRAYYNFQLDPTRRLQPWTTPCGHVFHRKCLEEAVQWQEAMTLGTEGGSLNPQFEANCPACTKKFSLQSSLPLYPVVRMGMTEYTRQSVEVVPRRDNSGSAMNNSEGSLEVNQVQSLQDQVEKLQDANGALEMLLIHNEAELENYTTKLEEFRGDLLSIVSRVDQLLVGIGNKPGVSERTARGTITSSRMDAPVTNTTAVQTAATPSSSYSVPQTSQAERPVTMMPTSETVEFPGMSRVGGVNRRHTSSTPSISNTLQSYHTAPSSSAGSSHCSVSSVRSVVRARHDGPGGDRNSVTRSHPNLPGSTGNHVARRRRNAVWEFFVTSFFNPGRVRE